ncbi:MAG: ferric reductase-like transmembrane domain-containing protein [Actinomycetes bacterium]
MTVTAERSTLPVQPAPVRVRANALLAGIGVGTVMVIALWWHDTSTIRGFGDWLTNAGRVTGLLAGYAVAVLLLLMARVPAIDRGVGSDRLARWHSMGGRYTVSLASAHAALIIWGYAVTAHTNVVSQTKALIVSYPDVLMATAALGLLIGVGIVSARAVRTRLSYETWHYLHFYTYLAVALAFSHQFATGADFMTHPAARLLWGAMYAVVAALVLWYRFLTPTMNAVRHRAHVERVQPEGPNVVSIVVYVHDLSRLGVEAGQFFRWRFLTRDMWWQAHPFSISAPPQGNYLRVTVKGLGDHSRDLAHLTVGTRVILEGPYGAFTAAKRRRRKVLLIAGGIGITPLRALLETMPAKPGDLTLVYRINTPEEAVFVSELKTLAASRGVELYNLVGAPGSHNDPFVGKRLRQLIPDVSRRDVFLCGPPGFADAAKEASRGVGVPRRHIHIEQFAF